MIKMKSTPTPAELEELVFKSECFFLAAQETAGPAGIPAAEAAWRAEKPFVPPTPAIIAKRLAQDPKHTQASLLKLYQGIYDERCHAAAVEKCGPITYAMSPALCGLLMAIVKHANPVGASFGKFLDFFGGCALEASNPGTMAGLWAALPSGAEPTLAELAAAGHPGGYTGSLRLCDEMRDRHRERWLCDPTRYLFSEKAPVGYYAMSDSGDWDKTPTPPEVFKDKKEFRIWVPPTGKQKKGHWEAAEWIDNIRSFSRRVYDYSSKEPLVIVDGINCWNQYVPSLLEPVAGNWEHYRALMMNLVADGRPWVDAPDDVRLGQLRGRVCWISAEIKELEVEQSESKSVASLELRKKLEVLRRELRDAEVAVVDGEQAIRDHAAFNYFMDWLAKPLQSLVLSRKTYRMGTAVWLHGDEGVGKSVLYDALCEMYGESNCFKLTQALLDGKFGAHMRGKLLINGNEVVSHSNRGEEVANKLKDWITDKTIAIEGKGVDGVEEPNHFNILMFSNSDKPAYLGPSDRRNNFFRQTKKLDPELGAAIHDDRVGDKAQLKAFFHELLTRKCQVKYGQLFENAPRADQRIEAEDSLSKFLRRIGTLGWDEVVEPWLNGPRASGEERSAYDHGAVLSSTMVLVYNFWCRLNNVHAVQYPEGKFKKTMKRLGMAYDEVTVGKRRLLGFKNITGVQPPRELPQGLHSSAAENELEPSGSGG